MNTRRREYLAIFISLNTFDIPCLCETWLDSSFKDGELFLPDYHFVRSERDHGQHRGVLIGIRSSIYFEEITFPENMNVSGCCFAAVHITCETSFIILCVYNPPLNSNYLWPSTLFRSLLSTLSSTLPMVPIILAGDINLSAVNWDEMSSINSYEQECVDIFLGFNLTQLNKTNDRILDVCLSNSPSLIVSVSTYPSPILDGSPMSDHEPLCIHTLMSNGSHRRTRRSLFSFKKMDKEGILKAMKEDPFIPYCWTNPALMVQHWHEWLEPKLDTFVPRKTAHRSSLPHWITPTTSNVIMRLKTAETQAEKGVISEKHKQKLAQLKADVERMSEEDLSEYQDIFLLDALQRKSSNI